MGIDAVVVRHSGSGVPWQVARWLHGPSVINAGDGWHEHPTQALLDCYTIRQRAASGAARPPRPRPPGPGRAAHRHRRRRPPQPGGPLRRAGLHQPRAPSVTLVAPPTLLPPSLAGWPVEVSHDLDAVLPKLDVVYLLRLQQERMIEALLPSLREYTATYGLTRERARLLADGALIMHPGPVNRGVEVAAEVADLPASVITRQVANGVAVRMAVLYLLLGSGVDLVAA